MSIIHINQIANKMKELFSEKLDKKDLSESDPSYEDKILTRCLAAYGIYNAIDCSSEDAASSVVDGGDDNGIDAIFYSALNKKMVIVQSKWSKNGSGEPKSGDIGKFCDGIKDLFNADFERFNDKIKLKQSLIEKALNSFETKYELVLIDTHTTNELAKHASRRIQDLLSEMNNTGDDLQEQIVTFKRINQSTVFQALARSSGDEPIDISLNLTQWGTITEPYTAFYGVISGEEIFDWWKDYGGRLFEKNIRRVLGATDVNEEIEGTIINNQNYFWYFNNGITIICDNIEKSKMGGSTREYGSFKLTNAAVVNGAQTVSTIGKFDKSGDSSLENLKVHIRIISLKSAPENFGDKVTKANNRQNRIENRDFVSKDPEQLRIKTELLIENIDYSIMRSEQFVSTEKSFDLNEAIISLVCVKNKTPLTVQAKRGIGKFYENLDKGIYKAIFNNSIQGIYLYNCVQVNRLIEKKIRTEIENLPKKSGKTYGTLVHGNRILSQLAFATLELGKNLNSIDFEPNETEIKMSVVTAINELESELLKQFPDSILGTLFKNTGKCTLLVNNIQN